MILPSKLYDVLKLIAGIIPLIVTAFGTIALAVGMGEEKVNIVLIIIGAVGTFIKGFLEICKANYYKVKVGDIIMNLSDYDTVESELDPDDKLTTNEETSE